ncbi:MAG: 50S ribosomal protein L11 methyltransferase [Candidatus Marinimicrobia bacterium]|nr:50S ribosomal protein L11 methyltransferase [Candidatus Neomarinimicrobiota bacterium]
MYSKKKTDRWREIEILNIQDPDGRVANFLFERGCLGITEDKNKLVLYFDAESPQDIPRQIEEFLAGQNFTKFEVLDHSIKDEDWHLKWQEYFTPQKITDTITVYPEWLRPDPATTIPILIRPGMAFGTGTHETTQMAIQLLEKSLTTGMKILDAGCGTGILTIAALKLGAAAVDSVEIDAEALDNFNENMALNHCQGKMLVQDVTTLAHYQYDLIVSNIQFNPNVALLKTLQQHNFKNPVIFTGILKDESDHFLKIVGDLGRKVTGDRTKNEWAAFLVVPE